MRAFLLSIPLAVALVSTPVRAQIQAHDAASLLALHHAYVGWHFGDGTFGTMREEGTITDTSRGRNDVDGSITVLRWGALYREDTVDRKTLTSGSDGFTGRVFWRSNRNGFTHPITGDAAKLEVSRSFVFNEATDELAGVLENPQSVNGVQCQVVRVTPAEGFPIDLYIDPATGAYKRYTIDPGGNYEDPVDVLSYAEVSGKRVLGSYRPVGGDHVITFTTLTPNVTLSPSDLHPPAQTASWDFTNPKPFKVTITHFRVLIDATVNGVQGRFLLDTGADGVYLDRGFAGRAHVQDLHGDTSASTIYDVVRIKTGLADTIAIGGNTLSHVVVNEISFTDYDYRGLDGQGYDGLLGYDVFANALVRLSFGDSTMTISDPDSTDLAGERGLTLGVDLSDEVPAIAMTLNDAIPVVALLDTGNPEAVFYGPELRREYHIPDVGCLQLRSLAFGPVRYVSQMACEAALDGHHVLVGFDFLKHFNLIFDYPRGEMVLEPLSQ